jgi:predicted nucleic acid-binding protein
VSKYLLDVNALVAWGQQRSPQHPIFHGWAKRQGFAGLSTCAHVELGFVRISMQVFGDSLEDAQTQLTAIKQEVGKFVIAAPSPKLAAWAKRPSLTSDAYLAQVATSAGLTLATFDTTVPGATLIR